MKDVLLECVLCDELYIEEDVVNFRFFPATNICYDCYRSMQKADFSLSCFGKKTDGDNLGFDIMAGECRTLCPDRSVCSGFANGKFIKLRKLAEKDTQTIKHKPVIRQYPFRQSSILFKAFKLCANGVLKTTLKRWCRHRDRNYHWVLRILRSGKSKNGKRWGVNETRDSIQLEYPFRR